jgi:tRNA dimethylallyltransferase
MINKQKTKEKIIIILGPTATGKSDLAVSLAKKFNGEIISADSRQVYVGLDMGTGKITKKEMKGIPHYLLDVISPNKTFTIADWKKQTEVKIWDILKRGKLPIIVGGTGFYIQSIVDGVVLPEVKPNKKLRTELEGKNLKELILILGKLDKERLKNIDTKNKVRLIRAIEIAKALGAVPKVTKIESPFEILQIGLTMPEKELKSKIHNRILFRMKKGMVREAENLYKNGLSLKRMRELGLEYRLLADLLQKNISKQEFIEKLEKEIWQYVKRQNTWFKRDKKINWFKPTDAKKIEKAIHNLQK